MCGLGGASMANEGQPIAMRFCAVLAQNASARSPQEITQRRRITAVNGPSLLELAALGKVAKVAADRSKLRWLRALDLNLLAAGWTRDARREQAVSNALSNISTCR